MAEENNRDILKENQEKMREFLDQKEDNKDNLEQDSVKQQRENQSIQDQARMPDENNKLKPDVANRKQAGQE